MTDLEAFAALGLRPGASPARVEAAYREKVWAAHPDRGGEAAAFAALGEARRAARAAAETWPCEACRGSGRSRAALAGFTATTLMCGHCGGTGKKW